MSRLISWPCVVVLVTTLLAGACGPSAAPASPPQPANTGGSQPPQPPNSGGSQTTAAKPAPPAPLAVTVNWSAINGAQAGIWTAYETGLFREQGLDVNLTHIQSTSQVVKTMVAGEVHLSTLDAAAAILSSLEGAEVSLLFSAANRLIFSVLGQPSIQDPQDLRGKTVGITRIGSASHTAGLVAFKMWGLVPDRDFPMRQLGEASAILAGLHAGQIDAGVMSSPTSTVARVAGFRELINLYTQGPDYPSIIIGAPRPWVAANDETVRRFARAYVQGQQRFKSEPEVGRAIYRKYFEIEDSAVVEQTYAEYSASIQPLPYISEGGLNALLADLAADEPRLAGRQAAEFVDTRYLKELEAVGVGR
jgi:NitT/TauT family transport system substrate-binding protein